MKRAVTDAANGKTRAVCRYLRTKQTAPTVIDDLVLPWEAGEDPAACFTCLATQSPVGPDDAVVHPHHCREGRSCFRARDAGSV